MRVELSGHREEIFETYLGLGLGVDGKGLGLAPCLQASKQKKSWKEKKKKKEKKEQNVTTRDVEMPDQLTLMVSALAWASRMSMFLLASA